MSEEIPRELDERVAKLNEKLQKIILMYLAHKISTQVAIRLGDKVLLEALKDLIRFFVERYDTPADYPWTISKIEKILNDKQRDFEAIVTTPREGEEGQTEAKKLVRALFISSVFIYAVFAEATVQLAITLRVPYLRFNTMQDHSVCPICQSYEGLYYVLDPNLPSLPVHVGGRCWWTLVYKRKKETLKKGKPEEL